MSHLTDTSLGAAPEQSPALAAASLALQLEVAGEWVTELRRRIKREFVVEWPMLQKRWRLVLWALVMQYVHGMFTQLAYKMHVPAPAPLHDLGFALTPTLGPRYHWVSETIFVTMFLAFALWTFAPFVQQHKRFYTVVLWARLLTVVVACQVLRMLSFTSTQLPGPAFHCRAASRSSTSPWFTHWWQFFIVDVGNQVSKSCGDLIFSSHTTFILTGTLAYHEYGASRAMKAVGWAAAGVLSLLIIASRKHYTVDVVVAWYAVPLVFYTLQRRWTTHRPMLQMFAETAAEAERESDSRYGGSSADLLKHDIMELQGIRIDGGGGGGRVAVEAAGGGGGLGESAPLLASSMEAGGFRAKLGPSSLGWDPAARAHIVSVVNNGGAAGGNGTAGNGGWGDSSEGNGALLAAGRAATGPMVRTRSAAAMSQQQGNGGGGGADGSFAASSALPAAPSLAPAHEDASSEYDDGPRHHSSAGHHASSLRGSTCRVS